MVKDGDTDIQDLLRGDAALLDAAKKGCLARVQKLCSPENINCRDTQGRNSTPLHLAGEQGPRRPWTSSGRPLLLRRTPACLGMKSTQPFFFLVPFQLVTTTWRLRSICWNTEPTSTPRTKEASFLSTTPLPTGSVQPHRLPSRQMAFKSLSKRVIFAG